MIKNCVICGDAFEARNSRHSTCGPGHSKQLEAEKNRESDRKRRAENPEIARERDRKACRKWRAENPERAREFSRKWAMENREKVRDCSQKWRAENPERAREAVRRSTQKTKDLKTLSNLLAMQAGFTVEKHHV